MEWKCYMNVINILVFIHGAFQKMALQTNSWTMQGVAAELELISAVAVLL